ncbi:MAG: dihydroorotase [Lachnospiraceae bacterium]|nr:dihydroorotase [Lachnospiraceae bacterium]
MLVIKNGRYINPATGHDEITDIYIERDRIKLIGKDIHVPGADLIDAQGMVVAPGFVDVHAHFRDPGQTDKEDILSGSLAAIKGGYTSVVLMANTNPPVDSVNILRDILCRAKKSAINIYSCAKVTAGNEAKEITDMEALSTAGAVGFSDDGEAIIDEELLIKAMKAAKELGKPICLHEEDPRYIDNPGINEGHASARLLIKGASRNAEITMIRRDLELSAKIGATTVFQHLSTKEGVELIREMKKSCPSIYAEVTPHHFSLTEEAIIKKQADAKMNPPLRIEEDRLALIEGLKDGTIDFIATDHAPHRADEKNADLIKAPSGIIGLETALSLGIKELVNPGHLSLSELIFKMSTAPAKLYNLPAGDIGPGQMADIVIFAPDETWEVKEFASKSANSPFLGETLPGVVHYTLCKGVICGK